jgi:hypothetical protein
MISRIVLTLNFVMGGGNVMQEWCGNGFDLFPKLIRAMQN